MQREQWWIWFTLPAHLSSRPFFSGVRVTRSLALCECFVDRFLSFCPFFFWSLCCLSFKYFSSTWFFLFLFQSESTGIDDIDLISGVSLQHLSRELKYNFVDCYTQYDVNKPLIFKPLMKILAEKIIPGHIIEAGI